MKRPILIAVIGYIIGIIWGLYFKISIALFYAIIILIAEIIKFIYKKVKSTKRNFKLFSLRRYARYLKLILNKKILITIIVFSTVSNGVVLLKNKKYNTLYSEIDNVTLIGIVEDLKTEGKYKNVYKFKNLETNTYVYLNVNKKINLEYGIKIKIDGEFIEPEGARNYGGFNYKDYLKTLEVYGTVNVKHIEKISHKSEINFIERIKKFMYELKQRIIKTAQNSLDKDTYSIYLGLILGDTSQIDENTKDKFRNSNMSHVLAVSGMHISYIILGITLLISKTNGKRISKIVAIICLILYSIITGFSPSIVRATIMGIMVLISGLIYRKNDIWTAISVSALILLVSNPYLIMDIGFQFSYLGTIGIILFHKNILKLLNKGKENNSKLKQIISVTLSAQIFILPLSIWHFNTIGFYFLLTNILLNVLIGPVIVSCFIYLIFIILNIPLINIISSIIYLMIKVISLISNIGNLPFSTMYLKTPSICEIILFYLFIIIVNTFIFIKYAKKPNMTSKRVMDIIQVIKYKFKTNHKKRKIISIALVIVIILHFVFNSFILRYYRDLKIHFVDVSQGDCCFIETPAGKTILIDGGGSESGDFDVGKNTLIPYILDRGYTSVDYIIISHFDTDHVGGLITVLERLKVRKVIISNQAKTSENYEKFKQIVNKKNINTLYVKKADKLKIEKDIYIDVIWPDNSKLIDENALNNNSIVCKFNYKSFSILFTGDIEKIAEEQILEEYRDNLQVLEATVLKIAHHGSKTSSTQEFIEAVKPKIALIGVGKNNKFGHPNKPTLDMLENRGIQVFRTDTDGEISIIINRKQKMYLQKTRNVV